MTPRIPVVCLMGPTASGKTAWAVELVQRFPLEIVSVDSAMVYRGMDVGTAKPDADELARAPHRLIDICDPMESYSAARFREDALGEIHDIRQAGRIPLLVGGTMLYFRALTRGLSPVPPSDPVVRARIEAEAAAGGWPALHRRLREVDPAAAVRIHANDSQRIQRALEVHALTGKPISALQANRTGAARGLEFLCWALAPADRQVLHRRIEQRFLAMLEAGFVEEVERLRARGDLGLNHPSMRAVGYRQIWQFLDGLYGRDEMIRRGVAASRQFAKRQLTWLRSEPELEWFDAGDRMSSDECNRRLERLVTAVGSGQ